MATITSFPLETVILSPLIGIKQTYSTTTADADPGDGVFRLNNATVASATAAYLDDEDSNARDVSAIWDRMDDSTSTIKGILRFENPNDQSIWAEFEVTGTVVDGTGYRKVTLQSGVSAGTFASGAEFLIHFTPKGDAGDADLGSLSGIDFVRKPSTESVSSSTTLQNDNDFVFAIAANQRLYIELDLLVFGAAAADIKLDVTLPSGGSALVSYIGPDPSTTDVSNTNFTVRSVAAGTAVQVGCDGTSQQIVFVKIAATNGANAGNVTLQWAQWASSGTATEVRASSVAKVWKL